MPEDEIKYAVYVVLVEDSDRSFNRMAEGVDSFEVGVTNQTYGEALQTMTTAAENIRETARFDA